MFKAAIKKGIRLATTGLIGAGAWISKFAFFTVHFCKKNFMKHITLQKVLTGLLIISLMVTLRFIGLSDLLLNLLLDKPCEILQWFFAGIVSLSVRLPMLGVIEAMVADFLSYIKSHFIIYCDGGVEPPMIGTEFVSPDTPTWIWQDHKNHSIRVPKLGINVFLSDPFTKRDWDNMHPREIALYRQYTNSINRAYEESKYVILYHHTACDFTRDKIFRAQLHIRVTTLSMEERLKALDEDEARPTLPPVELLPLDRAMLERRAILMNRLRTQEIAHTNRTLRRQRAQIELTNRAARRRRNG